MTVKSPIAVIRIDGEEINSETVRAIKKLSLTQRDRKADTGEIVFRDPDFELFDSRKFKKGTEFTILMGWTDDMEPRGPFIVKKYKMNFPDSGEAEFSVQFQDKSQRMNRRQRRRRFSGVVPHQIVRQIADDYGLSAEIESVDNEEFTEERPLLQANTTDGRLLQQLAERYGYVWGIEGNTLYFRRPVDRQQLGIQEEVPVLSYRINDYSLKSFSPEIKFNSGRRRRGARQRGSNIDLVNGTNENNGIFNVAQTRESATDVVSNLREFLNVESGEDSDDDEPAATQSRATDTQSNTSNQRVERSAGRITVDSITQAFGRILPDTQQEQDENENEESEPGDESGAATPDNEQEANRRTSSRVVRASEIVEGKAVPTTASMKWKHSMAVIVAGVGERLSGRYKISEVTQTVSSSAFETMLTVKRQTFRPSSSAQQRISEATDEADQSENSAENQPSRTSREESRVAVDSVRQRFGRRIRVDGQEQ
jgi:phage protein D